MEHRWIQWIREIRALSQTGLAYTKDVYDKERYARLIELANTMFAHIGDVPIRQITEFFVPDAGYCTPKVDLRAGIFQEDRILLVLEKSDRKWTLPGGWADVNESPSQGIRREVLEEAGCEIAELELTAIIDRGAHPYTPHYPHSIYKLFFYGLCAQCQPLPANHETEEAAWFSSDTLPELSEARVLHQDIERLFCFHQKKCPVYVD